MALYVYLHVFSLFACLQMGVEAGNDDDSDVDDFLFFDTEEGDSPRERELAALQSSNEVLEEAAFTSHTLMKYFRDHSIFVPAMIYVDDVRRSMIGSRREIYVFCVPRELLYPHEPSTSIDVGKDDDIQYCVTLGSYKEFERMISPILSAPESNVSTRLQRMEKRRRDLQESMTQLCEKCPRDSELRSRMQCFFRLTTHTSTFLIPKQSTSGVGSSQKRSDIGEVVMGSLVCVRSGQTVWSEEYMCLTSSELVFVKPSSKLLASTTKLKISLDDIREVKMLDSRSWPFFMDSCYFLNVSTLTRVYTIIIRGGDVLNDWVSAIASALDSSHSYVAKGHRSHSNSDWANFQNLEFLTFPMDWKLADRVILNGRAYNGRLHFERPLSTSFDEITSLRLEASSCEGSGLLGLDVASHSFPLLLLERSLDLIFSLSEYFDREGGVSGDNVPWSPSVDVQWVEFLTNISYLPCINLEAYSFSETELTCIFVNLYHIMVLHAFLVAGVPSTLMKWPSFFNSCAYEAFGDIFSLSELEHCIVKAGEFAVIS